jgi:hypothetical protein
MTCQLTVIQPKHESFLLIRRLVRVEQPVAPQSPRVAQRGGRLRSSFAGQTLLLLIAERRVGSLGAVIPDPFGDRGTAGMGLVVEQSKRGESH